MLEPRFEPPANWQWQTRLEPRDGQFLRFGWAAPENPRALVCIFPGLSEYSEKYFEVAHDLLARNYAVAVLDWRGQGLSWRHDDNPRLRLHDGFENDVDDAACFLKNIPIPSGLPRILLAHSMGANIGLRLLQANKDAFHCAVMTAPMFGINLPGPVDPLVRLVALAAAKCGMRKSLLPGGKDWSETAFHNNIQLLTADPARIGMQLYWMTSSPALRMGSLTFGWLEQALKSIRVVSAFEWLSAVETPCLAILSGHERVVSNPAIKRIMDKLPHAEIVRIDGARHEVMMERDVYRNQFWTAFDGFVAKHL